MIPVLSRLRLGPRGRTICPSRPESGNYIVAFKKKEMRVGPNVLVDLFAPGTQDRGNAQVIELGKATRVESIELIVPRSDIDDLQPGRLRRQ